MGITWLGTPGHSGAPVGVKTAHARLPLDFLPGVWPAAFFTAIWVHYARPVTFRGSRLQAPPPQPDTVTPAALFSRTLLRSYFLFPLPGPSAGRHARERRVAYIIMMVIKMYDILWWGVIKMYDTL